ncbi:hypothetical protein KJ751_02300 [Patescibacteria group bacterium]|nr:hypothetical protein [Patescibacteria group bacterium]
MRQTSKLSFCVICSLLIFFCSDIVFAGDFKIPRIPRNTMALLNDRGEIEKMYGVPESKDKIIPTETKEEDPEAIKVWMKMCNEMAGKYKNSYEFSKMEMDTLNEGEEKYFEEQEKKFIEVANNFPSVAIQILTYPWREKGLFQRYYSVNIQKKLTLIKLLEHGMGKMLKYLSGDASFFGSRLFFLLSGNDDENAELMAKTLFDIENFDNVNGTNYFSEAFSYFYYSFYDIIHEPENPSCEPERVRRFCKTVLEIKGADWVNEKLKKATLREVRENMDRVFYYLNNANDAYSPELVLQEAKSYFSEEILVYLTEDNIENARLEQIEKMEKEGTLEKFLKRQND